MTHPLMLRHKQCMEEERGQVVEAYKQAGMDVGHVGSIPGMAGISENNYLGLVERWAAAEEAYAALGYRLVTLQDFTLAGGWSANIDYLFERARKKTEPVFQYARAHLAEVKAAFEKDKPQAVA